VAPPLSVDPLVGEVALEDEIVKPPETGEPAALPPPLGVLVTLDAGVTALEAAPLLPGAAVPPTAPLLLVASLAVPLAGLTLALAASAEHGAAAIGRQASATAISGRCTRARWALIAADANEPTRAGRRTGAGR
jgi:hypothetical protein